MTSLTRALLPALLFVAGCSAIEGLFSDDKTTEASGATTSTTTSSASGVQPGQGAWRVLIIMDTSADHSFFAPEQAFDRVLDGTGIKLVRAWALGPVEIKNDEGDVIGNVDLKTVTDQSKGYVLAEAGRPYDFVAPSSLPFVLQQASSYFGTTIRMNNGRAAGEGSGMGMSGGNRPIKQGKNGAPGVPEGLRQHMRMPPGARKVSKGPGGADAGADATEGAEGATDE
jgi:hypothetical protein